VVEVLNITTWRIPTQVTSHECQNQPARELTRFGKHQEIPGEADAKPACNSNIRFPSTVTQQTRSSPKGTLPCYLGTVEYIHRLPVCKFSCPTALVALILLTPDRSNLLSRTA